MIDKVTVLSVAHAPGTSRVQARLAIRAALTDAIVGALALADVEVASTPGAAPQLLVNGQLTRIGIAISHTDSFSFAAWHPNSPIGLDVMQIVAIPDWRALTRDYLGPQALARLETLPAQALDSAFAREWTAREACLKCLGLGIAEWTTLPIACMLEDWAPQPGYAGAIARPAVPMQQARQRR